MDKNTQKAIFFAFFAIVFLGGAVKYQEYVNENSPKAIYERQRVLERHKKDSIEDYQEHRRTKINKLKDNIIEIIKGNNDGAYLESDDIIHFYNGMNSYNFHISNVSFTTDQINIYAVCKGKCIRYNHEVDTNKALICGYSNVAYNLLQEYKKMKDEDILDFR